MGRHAEVGKNAVNTLFVALCQNEIMNESEIVSYECEPLVSECVVNGILVFVEGNEASVMG